jgi:arginase
MTVSLIQVPYVLGDERQGTSKGPGRLVEAGADKVVAAKGVAVRVERVDRGGPFRDSGNASLKACKQLADVVRKTVQAGAFPLILSGGCDVSKGILSGFDQSQCGIVWFDAHGDFNTPETTASGYLDGMSLAILTGHCYQSYWAQVGNSAPVADSASSSNSPQQSLCCGGSAQAPHARPRKAGLLESQALCCLCSLPVWPWCQR